MASTYTNDLRLELIAVGEGSGTAPSDWGSKTNVNLTSIASAFGPGTENLASDADATLTLADGAADEMRALYLKITSSGSLTATRTITIAPNTVAKLWIIENATTGSQSLTISQGSGANVTIGNSAVKMVYTDGAGSGAAVIDALVDLDLTGTTTIATASVTNLTFGGTAISATGAEINIMDGVTSTTAELNILDGVTATTAEINIVDGDTAATSTTLADADRVVVNDGGTMVQVALTDFETYFETSLDTLSNVTTVGALNAGSIASGFGAINNGSSAITTTGTITYGSISDGSITITAFVDEDNMSSNSATMVPTQQSVKQYVDVQVGAAPTGTATYANFDVTTSLQIPDGTTAERPGSPSVGNLRYNTTTGAVEIYHTSGWGALNTVVDDSITTAKIADDAVTQAKVADDAIGADQLAASAVVTASMVDDSVTQAKVADDAIDEARLQISNAGTNGQYLQKQSGETGGLIWADVAGLETIYVPAAAMYPNTTAGCAALAQVELSNGPELKCLDFDASSDENAQFTVAFPKSWNEGTVTFQAFWTVTGTNTGTVAWGLSAGSMADDASINTAFGTNVVATAKAFSGTSNDMTVSATSGAVTIANAAADTMTYFQIMRDVSADDQSGDARLLGIKLFFTTDAANDA